MLENADFEKAARIVTYLAKVKQQYFNTSEVDYNDLRTALVESNVKPLYVADAIDVLIDVGVVTRHQKDDRIYYEVKVDGENQR